MWISGVLDLVRLASAGPPGRLPASDRFPCVPDLALEAARPGKPKCAEVIACASATNRGRLAPRDFSWICLRRIAHSAHYSLDALFTPAASRQHHSIHLCGRRSNRQHSETNDRRLAIGRPAPIADRNRAVAISLYVAAEDARLRDLIGDLAEH